MTEVRDWKKDMELRGHHVQQSHRSEITISVLQGNLEAYTKETERLRGLVEAEKERADKLREAIEKSLNMYRDDCLDNDEALSAIHDELESVISSLYPLDKEEEAK